MCEYLLCFYGPNITLQCTKWNKVCVWYMWIKGDCNSGALEVRNIDLSLLFFNKMKYRRNNFFCLLQRNNIKFCSKCWLILYCLTFCILLTFGATHEKWDQQAKLGNNLHIYLFILNKKKASHQNVYLWMQKYPRSICTQYFPIIIHFLSHIIRF